MSIIKRYPKCRIGANWTFCESILLKSPDSSRAGPKNLSEIAMRYSLRQAETVEGSILYSPSAQGRTDPNQNTGTSIHNCTVTASPELGPVLEWSGDFALSTLYYGEYDNSGPGSDTSQRVTWPGYHVLMNISDAQNFTVISFISGDIWLPLDAVPFDAGLL
ncbi:hypothetical protein SUGI_0138940 [Cryptomeria japonica]|nr:hypothetical protein SUGI_0138940 [Cryptomeria japonica]